MKISHEDILASVSEIKAAVEDLERNIIKQPSLPLIRIAEELDSIRKATAGCVHEIKAGFSDLRVMVAYYLDADK